MYREMAELPCRSFLRCPELFWPCGALGCCAVCCWGAGDGCFPVFSGCGFSSAITVRLINRGRNHKNIPSFHEIFLKPGIIPGLFSGSGSRMADKIPGRPQMNAIYINVQFCNNSNTRSHVSCTPLSIQKAF